ncbi:MAG: DNA repair protein RecN [Gemmatimonadaceae bacterium]|nr:DNA repair protein RecN [Gemmatimonadaceae bacterium]
MLAELRIRNVAIIESVKVPFGPGLNVLTGETGAGKSIIIGALGLLGGGRWSADDVRTGTDRATVEGEFHARDNADVLAALDAHGIEAEGGVVTLRREVTASGRSRAWVNGTVVTASVLAAIGRTLFTIHGQNDARALLDEDSQRQMLDRYARATGEARALADAHAGLEESRANLARRVARRDDAEKRADYLRHVADEVERARLVTGEEEALEGEAARLAHAEELTTATAQMSEALDGSDEAVLTRLGHLQRLLGVLQRIDPSAAKIQAAYDAAYYAIEELAREAAAYAESIEHDPARLEEVQRRRDVIFRLLKKYGGTMERALAAGREARAELDALDTAAHDIGAMEAAVRTSETRVAEAAQALTASRARGAAALSRAVAAQLPALGMDGGSFLVRLVPHESPRATGAEWVEYRVALNVGHEDRPLARVASGGELARVMLALQVILADMERVPTLVFDEVDSGIGGAVALMVADALRAVSLRRQVFAITHLAQIGSRAAHHVVVRKGAREGVTSADVTVLDGDARVDEVARMLGGDPASEVSRAHARELLGAQPPTRQRRARAG